MKRLLKTLLTIFAVVALATSCSSGKDDTTDTVIEKSAREEVTQEEKKVETSEDADKIVVGVSGEMYPTNYLEDDELKGYEIDLWKEMADRENFEVEFVTAKFSGLFGMVDSGQIDTIANIVAINDEREEKYAFTDTYLTSNYQLVTQKGSPLNTLEDFKGKRVGVVAGGTGDQALQKVSNENNLDIEIVGYDGTPGMDSDLDLGRIDARLGPAIQTQGVIDKNDLNFEVTDVVIFKEINAFPFLKDEGQQSKIDKVNKALASMKEDGSLKELSLKWFSLDATTE